MKKEPVSSGNFNHKSDFLQYIDRKTGKRCVESIHGGWALKLLYQGGWLSRLLLPLIAHFSASSWLYGWLMKGSWSKCLIRPFIRAYQIDSDEFEKQNFESFNDFFTRRLKKGARPVCSDPRELAFPADGRYLVYPKIEHIYAKGQTFSLQGLLDDPLLAKRYVNGSMMIARLCPVDYHRFHFPCDGVPNEARLIQGPLFSVSPIALRKRLSILWQNKRMITEIDTTHFGKIAYVEIGATNVGSIQQTYVPHQPVLKGDEKGYFEFGGSCLILLFEPGVISFSDDLIRNTQDGIETLCRFGDKSGSSLLCGL